MQDAGGEVVVDLDRDLGLAGARHQRAGQAPCLIRPLARGFDGGALVACPGQPEVAVKVDDDLAAGVLHVTTGAVLEVFRYDPDSGKLLSAAAPPPVTESNYPPAD